MKTAKNIQIMLEYWMEFVNLAIQPEIVLADDPVCKIHAFDKMVEKFISRKFLVWLSATGIFAFTTHYL